MEFSYFVISAASLAIKGASHCSSCLLLRKGVQTQEKKAESLALSSLWLDMANSLLPGTKY